MRRIDARRKKTNTLQLCFACAVERLIAPREIAWNSVDRIQDRKRLTRCPIGTHRPTDLRRAILTGDEQRLGAPAGNRRRGQCPKIIGPGRAVVGRRERPLTVRSALSMRSSPEDRSRISNRGPMIQAVGPAENFAASSGNNVANVREAVPLVSAAELIHFSARMGSNPRQPPAGAIGRETRHQRDVSQPPPPAVSRIRDGFPTGANLRPGHRARQQQTINYRRCSSPRN
jgi:hypothetical protein